MSKNIKQIPYLKSLIKQTPWLYKPLKKSYWLFQALKHYIGGTAIHEHYWANRHKHSGNDWGSPCVNQDQKSWLMAYWQSKNHPHRYFLIQHLSRYAPIKNILEIGCNCGPNLYLLAKKFPQATIQGIDINYLAVEFGRQHFKKLGINNVQLEIGQADQLDKFSDKSFDIIMTDAVLIYIAPDKIKKIIREMIRVSRKALVFLEQHQKCPGKDIRGLGIYQFGLWQRNYQKLLGQFLPQEKIKLTKLPPKLWPDKNWSQTGYIIEALL